jgi:hypothetical protein
MTRKVSLGAQADAIDFILKASAASSLQRKGFSPSEIELVIARATAARDTLRMLDPIADDLRKWLEIRRRGGA